MSLKLLNSGEKLTKQTGSALVIAIFVIVVMTLLGAALVKMLRSESESIVFEVFGTRAFQAAQIGLQQQLQKVFPLDDVAQSCTAVTTTPIQVNTVKGLENCYIVDPIVCTSFLVDEKLFYRIESTGKCQIEGIKTSRTLEVQARSL